jgi:hypothetical protein
MRNPDARFPLRWAANVLVVTLAVANSGCLLVAAGAAGGAAAGYAYYKGKVCETYTASLDDTALALRTALGELGMPILSEKREGTSGSLESRTAAGDRVRIQLEAEASKIPADGQVTRLCVRVATFGDELVSARVLTQVGFHLAPAAAVSQQATTPPAASPVIQAGASSPAPTSSLPQTAPPPLLPAEPVPAKP